MAEIGQISGKLQRLLLLLSSDQPGEVTAAAAAITRTLQSAGHDWHDLVNGLTATATAAAKPEFQNNDAHDWHAMRDACLKHRARLRGRELAFVTDLQDWRGPLTPKQRDWLTSIHERITRDTE